MANNKGNNRPANVEPELLRVAHRISKADLLEAYEDLHWRAVAGVKLYALELPSRLPHGPCLIAARINPDCSADLASTTSIARNDRRHKRGHDE